MATVTCVADVERHAHSVLPRNALDYYRSGADHMVTLRDNEAAFQRSRCSWKTASGLAC